jgi:hypothetical protein
MHARITFVRDLMLQMAKISRRNASSLHAHQGTAPRPLYIYAASNNCIRPHIYIFIYIGISYKVLPLFLVFCLNLVYDRLVSNSPLFSPIIFLLFTTLELHINRLQ